MFYYTSFSLLVAGQSFVSQSVSQLGRQVGKESSLELPTGFDEDEADQNKEGCGRLQVVVVEATATVIVVFKGMDWSLSTRMNEAAEEDDSAA